jgi:MFS family permease
VTVDNRTSSTELGKGSGGLRSNIWKYYAYKGLWGLAAGLWLPVLVLFFLGQGMDLSGFMVLMSVMNLSQFALEVPTGIVADRFSRKWSVCAGLVCAVCFAMACLTTLNYPLLVLAFAVGGAAGALISGADSAFLYDSLKAMGREQDFQRVTGNAVSIMLAATVLGTAICGIVAGVVGVSASMWLSCGCCALAALVTAAFGEPPFLEAAREKQPATSVRGHLSGYVSHLSDSFRFVASSSSLLALILVNIVVIRLCFLTERPFAQPYLSTFGYTPEYISYAHTAFYAITALFAKYAHRLGAILGQAEKRAIMLVCLLAGASLALMVEVSIGPVAIGAMIGIYAAKGLFGPVIQDSLNRRITSEKRASCLSIAQMGNNFLGIFLGPLFGYLADTLSLGASLHLFLWTFLPLLAIGAACVWWTVVGEAELESSTVSQATR